MMMKDYKLKRRICERHVKQFRDFNQRYYPCPNIFNILSSSDPIMLEVMHDIDTCPDCQFVIDDDRSTKRI